MSEWDGEGVVYMMIQVPFGDLAWIILEALGSEVSVFLPSLTSTSWLTASTTYGSVFVPW